jgi:hypothetical protein
LRSIRKDRWTAGQSPTIRFERTARLAAPPDRVFSELSDPRRYLGLQPLLVEVAPRDAGVDAEGRSYQDFESVERIRLFGPVSVSNRIESRLTREKDGAGLRIETRSRPGIRLRADYALRAEENATVLRLSVAIACPRLLAGLVRREAERAHDALLAHLTTRLEPPR